MDNFVRRFFNEFEAPGADFKFDNGPRTYTYMGCGLRTFDGEVTLNRNFYSSQAMTPLGLTECQLTGGASSLDGMTKQFLTPEGTMNLAMLADTLKATSGLQTAVLSQHVSLMQKWSWADNHVSLLMNMLRYTFLKRIEVDTFNLDGSLGIYDDGHARIDMDQWWPESYPEVSTRDGWPGGNDDDCYPDYLRITTSTPPTGDDVVDLRGLSVSEARFVLLMLGSWKRSSRYRLDYSTPKLLERVGYRSSVEIPNLEDWVGEDAESAAPSLLSWQSSWAALKGYVTQNRLFDHFSVALYILCASAYQFVPATAESTYWLSLNWTLVLPAFRSVRGRYEPLNEGEAAYVSHRALSEWGYINGNLEKLNLMALVFTQAYQTGFALRGVRKGLELSPEDVYQSEIDFYSSSNLISAAAAEAIRGEVPLPGMPGVHVAVSERFDDYVEDRGVYAENEDDEDLEGYDVDIVETAGARDEEVVVAVDAIADLPEFEQRRIKLRVNTLAAGARAKMAVDELVVLSEEEKLALRGETRRTVTAAEPRRRMKILMPWFTFAGIPTLLLPLPICPYNTPFSMKGSISPEIGVLERRGFRLKAGAAWETANLMRMCGYDAGVRLTGDVAGASEFFAPNNLSFVWPILHAPDSQNDDIMLIGQTQRPNLFIELPPITSRFFRGKKVDYVVRVMRRGTAPSPSHDRVDVSEWGGPVTLTTAVTVSYNVPEGVTRLRGYISRKESGFQFASNVQAGVIPPNPTVGDAPAVE